MRVRQPIQRCQLCRPRYGKHLVIWAAQLRDANGIRRPGECLTLVRCPHCGGDGWLPFGG